MTPRTQLVRRLVTFFLCLGFTLDLSVPCSAENRPERVEWFRDAGFGMFIHWSVDSQLGSVISHSLVGSSPDYAKRFFELLPRDPDLGLTFLPLVVDRFLKPQFIAPFLGRLPRQQPRD